MDRRAKSIFDRLLISPDASWERWKAREKSFDDQHPFTNTFALPHHCTIQANRGGAFMFQFVIDRRTCVCVCVFCWGETTAANVLSSGMERHESFHGQKTHTDSPRASSAFRGLYRSDSIRNFSKKRPTI